jgi:hypothetical protein
MLDSQKSGAAALVAVRGRRRSQMTCVAGCARLHGNSRRRRQTSPLLFWRLSKAYAGSATVLLDELKARELQDGTKRRVVRSIDRDFQLNSFYPTIAATPTFETWADRERSTVDEAIPADQTGDHPRNSGPMLASLRVGPSRLGVSCRSLTSVRDKRLGRMRGVSPWVRRRWKNQHTLKAIEERKQVEGSRKLRRDIK